MPFSSIRRAAVIALIAGVGAVCGPGGFGTTEAAAGATSLDRAWRILSGKTFVDLTHSFGPDTPVWPGFGQAAMTPAVDPKTHEPYTIAKDGFRATTYQMVGQYGTHIDPPAHFAENGATMDRIPPKQMILRLVVLDNTPYLAKDQNHAFSPADLAA
jgi:kynurenine formamidase